MLTKLLKYELRSSARIFGVVYLAILGLCVGSGVLNMISEDQKFTYINEPVSQVGLVVWIITALFLAASVVITTVINLRRFYVGLFRDEGYLMHTLPVRPWELLASKLLAAMAWTIATSLVLLLSVCLAVTIGYGDGFLDILEGMWETVTGLIGNPLNVPLALLELASIVLRVYAAIAIGHLFSRRVFAAVLVWFGLNTIQTWAGMLLGENIYQIMVEHMFAIYPTQTPPATYALLMGVALFWSAVYWAVTQWVMTRRLNLE